MEGPRALFYLKEFKEYKNLYDVSSFHCYLSNKNSFEYFDFKRSMLNEEESKVCSQKYSLVRNGIPFTSFDYLSVHSPGLIDFVRFDKKLIIIEKAVEQTRNFLIKYKLSEDSIEYLKFLNIKYYKVEKISRI